MCKYCSYLKELRIEDKKLYEKRAKLMDKAYLRKNALLERAYLFIDAVLSNRTFVRTDLVEDIQKELEREVI